MLKISISTVHSPLLESNGPHKFHLTDPRPAPSHQSPSTARPYINPLPFSFHNTPRKVSAPQPLSLISPRLHLDTSSIPTYRPMAPKAEKKPAEKKPEAEKAEKTPAGKKPKAEKRLPDRKSVV